jgi:arginase family enzyme
MDRDADLNIPATTPSGCVDGMVVSHLAGRGAAELVRFWSEPPLVREPDLALFGVERLDPPEEEVLRRSPLRRYLAADVQRMGAAAAAQAAVESVHGNGKEFALHLDVDVIADFPATDYPGSGGLSLEQVREALEIFTKHKQLAAIELAAYNPVLDPDGSGARTIVDLLASVLEARLKSLAAPVSVEAPAPASAPETKSESGAPPEPEPVPAATPAEVAPAEAWTSDSLGQENAEDSETTSADGSHETEDSHK